MSPAGSAATDFAELLIASATAGIGDETGTSAPPAEEVPDGDGDTEGSRTLDREEARPASRRNKPANKAVLRPKYVTMRSGQLGDLEELARDLMDARTAKGGQRITANTLIRVAVDALLAQRDLLGGDVEDEILRTYFKALGIPDKQIPKHAKS